MRFIKKHKLKNNKIIFGYVARFSPQKNHEFLFNCLSYIKKKHNIYFNLILIGNNIKNNQNLNTLINEYGLKKDILILKESTNINLVYPIFDLNFLVSSFGESFPNTLAESMLSGTPCISSNVGDSKYIIGKYGYVFSPNDKKKFVNCILKFRKSSLKKGNLIKLKKNCRKRIISLFDLNDKLQKYNKLIL